MFTEAIQERIIEHQTVTHHLWNDTKFCENISEIIAVLTHCFKSGGKLLICGNGGSAADSQHIATELVSKFFLERKAIDAEALTVNTSTLTAIGNDYDFDTVFSRQVEAKGRNGDVLLSLSTSGNSKNVIKAMKAAKKRKMITIGFTGNVFPNLMWELSNYLVSIPSDSTPRVQEAHILIGHIICELVEKNLFEGE